MLLSAFTISASFFALGVQVSWLHCCEQGLLLHEGEVFAHKEEVFGLIRVRSFALAMVGSL